MEIGLRGILILVGLVIIAIILFDGYRRARDSRKTAIKMSMDLEGTTNDEFDEFLGELPNGGQVRVISNNQQIKNDEILFDYTEQDLNPQFDDAVAVKKEGNVKRKEQLKVAEKALSAKVSTQQDLFGDAAADISIENGTIDVPEAAISSTEVRADSDEQYQEKSANQSEEVLILNVVGKPGKNIQGRELLGGLFNCGLHFGSMNIFHRFSHANGEGALMFSMANMVNPGVFDLDNINTFETPGVTFFMTLPGPKNSMTAFDLMLDTVRRLARILNAEVKDDSQQPLTQEVIDDYRRRIREFERTQILLNKDSQDSLINSPLDMAANPEKV